MGKPSAGVMMPVSGAGQPSRTVTVEGFEVTDAPPVVVAVAVAVSVILPAVMFLAVVVRVPVQVSLVPGASDAFGQDTAGTAGSVTPIPVKVVGPMLRTLSE